MWESFRLYRTYGWLAERYSCLGVQLKCIFSRIFSILLVSPSPALGHFYWSFRELWRCFAAVFRRDIAFSGFGKSTIVLEQPVIKSKTTLGEAWQTQSGLLDAKVKGKGSRKPPHLSVGSVFICQKPLVFLLMRWYTSSVRVYCTILYIVWVVHMRVELCQR